MKKIFAIHYLNPHFAGLEVADRENLPLSSYYGPIGQSELFEEFSDGGVKILFTIVGGDTHVAENEEKAISEVLKFIKRYFNNPDFVNPDVFFAGPCVKAGRYGNFAQAVCKAVSQKFNIPAITGMYPENPGVLEYKNDIFDNKESVYVIETSGSVMGTEEAIRNMIELASKVTAGEKVCPKTDNYIPRGRRVNVFVEKTGAVRLLDVLGKKMRGEPFETEMPLVEIEDVIPAPALVKGLSEAKIILGSTGGIVPAKPVLNPDKIAFADAKNWGLYSLEGLEALTAETHQSVHGGYARPLANKNPNWVVPVDLMRQLEKEGIIGELYNEYFVTVGNATEIDNAEKMAKEIIPIIRSAGVDAVVLTSTWGTCTRCGAAFIRVFDKAGIPCVHICSIIKISRTNKANRIVRANKIAHPVGFPDLSPEEDDKKRREMLIRALNALVTPIDKQTVFE